MDRYATLHELLACCRQSRQAFDALPLDVQVELQEQRQNIRTREELEHFCTEHQRKNN